MKIQAYKCDKCGKVVEKEIYIVKGDIIKASSGMAVIKASKDRHYCQKCLIGYINPMLTTLLRDVELDN